MDLNNKVTQLEDEIKVLKKEVQAVLLDLRENMLNRENPFSQQPLQPLAPPVVVAASFTQPPTLVEQKKESITEQKLTDAPSVKSKVELPPAITGAFQADEQLEFPPKKDMPTKTPGTDGLPPATNASGHCEKSGFLDDYKNTACDKPTKNVLETITSLVGWVETSVARLGFERTQAILDISEMMGHMSPEMKTILVKFMHPGAEPVEKIAFKDYMASLIELASLLGKKNDPNNVLFYTLYHGMYSMTEGKEKHG